MLPKFIFLIISLLFINFISTHELSQSKDIVFSKVERNIDVSSQLVKISNKITLENVGKSPIHSFLYALPIDSKTNVAYIGAELAENVPLEVNEVSFPTQSNYLFYKVSVPKKVEPSKTLSVSVNVVLANHLSPYPSQITQSEKQQVLLIDNHYLLSPYTVKTQTTNVVLTSNIIESYSRLKPVTQSENTITYGAYENIAPFSVDKMTVHYENNRPFLTVTNMERSIEVSHWGVISIEEQINIRHTGALLKGPFCRYEFQRDQSGFAAVKQFKTILPASAQDVYYRDEIGNISTSHLRTMEDSVEIELRPRFPLFGGWKTFYTLGYTVPTYEYLFNDGNKFVLNIRFVDHLFDDSVTDQALVRIILPEGSSNIEVKLPYPVTRLPDQLHYTYLDTIGRPMITLQKSNLVEQHISEIQVHYTHEKLMMLQEPMLVVIALYLLFLLVIVYVRLDFTISADPLKESRLRVMSLLEQVRNHQAKRSDIYGQFEAGMAKLKASKDSGTWQTLQKALNVEHKTETQAVQDLSAKLKLEGSDIVEKLAELQKLDKTLKDLLQQQATSLEKLIGSKMSKQQYLDSESTIVKKKEEASEKIQTLLAQI